MPKVLNKIVILLVSFLVLMNTYGQNLVLNGSMTGTVGENTVASNWTISPNIPPCPGCLQNTPDLNNTGPLQSSTGYSWYMGSPVESNNGGTWQNVFSSQEGFEQTISGLTIGQTYYFSFEYCSQGIICCGTFSFASLSAPNVNIIGAIGYANPSTTGSLYNWETVTATLVATSTSITIIAKGAINAYLAYDGFYLSTITVTPIKLNNFDVSQNQNDILLNWSTESEENTNRFEILKSIDGLNWAKIGNVSAAGNSSTRRDYYFYDQSVSIKNYYRLKVIDFDGKYSFSKVVFLKLLQTNNDIFSVFPNPAVNTITINLANSYKTESKLLIFNLAGQLVKDICLAPNTVQFSLNFCDLVKGHYTLILINSKTQIRTLILQ